MAQSLVDYMFRRMALDHLPYEVRSAYGIYSTDERADMLETEVEETIFAQDEIAEEPHRNDPAHEKVIPEVPVDRLDGIRVRENDAPLCMVCGTQTVYTGACAACPACGTTTGCS